jgi:hypothetical protein
MKISASGAGARDKLLLVSRIGRAMVLLALLAPAGAAGIQAPSPELAAGARCDRGRLAKALGVSTVHFALGCLLLESTPSERWLVAAAHQPDDARSREALPVILGVVHDDRALWRQEVVVGKDAGEEVQEAISKADDRFVWIEPQALGQARGARVGISSQWGERDSMVREVALVLRLPVTGDAPRLLWSGPGNARESRAEVCRIETVTTFRLVDEHTLERADQVRATFDPMAAGPRLSRAARNELKKNCVAPDPPPAPQRFPVAP